MRDLLLSQAVCKTWKGAIEGSVKLQKALFFMPDGAERVMLVMDHEGHSLDLTFKYKSATTGAYVKGPTPNTLITRIMVSLARGKIAFSPLGKVTIGNTSTAPEASWRRMFLSRPVLTWAHLVSNTYDFIGYLHQADGIKLEHVIAKLEAKQLAEKEVPRARRWNYTCIVNGNQLWRGAKGSFVYPFADESASDDSSSDSGFDLENSSDVSGTQGTILESRDRGVHRLDKA